MKCLLVFLYTGTHENIYICTHNYTERGGEQRGERTRGEERKSFPVSAAALLDMLTLTYISQLSREPYLPLMSVITSL